MESVTCYMTHDTKMNTLVSSEWTYKSVAALKSNKSSFKGASRLL